MRLREEPQPILTGIPARDFHQGGRIAFGPDAVLYVTVGDTYEQPHLAQDRSSLAGKILRITPQGKPAPGNPFPGSASGAWGTATSKAWPGTPKGALRQRVRSGPPRRAQLDPTGRQLRLAGRGGEGNDSRFVDPIVTWAPAEASPSGITVLDDRIYIACLRAERLYR